MYPSLIFPRDNFIKRGDLRLVKRIVRGRVYNPTVPLLSIAAWINTEAPAEGYKWVQFNGETAGFVTVDWGDGTQPQLVGPSGPHEFLHEYAAPGKYLVNISYSAGNGFYWTGSQDPKILNRQIIKAYVDRTPPPTPPTTPFG